MPDEIVIVGGISDRGTIVNLGAYWQDVRMEYSSGDLIYRGVHYLHNIETSDEEWEIWKYTWGADGLSRIEGPISAAWDDRATLEWG